MEQYEIEEEGIFGSGDSQTIELPEGSKFSHESPCSFCGYPVDIAEGHFPGCPNSPENLKIKSEEDEGEDGYLKENVNLVDFEGLE
ncbi:hypothetical protein COV23_01130 [Candidatus Wolfebacteria bacterium CG10_big_fil_rev_8_21_14_0_10_31_9]|uniref:Uncharacterized protein n=1 Tax=Candidatus Wolfebacteria bacterium CG10_big_fil_rev_8_21_14_0_10_31_9 TaxID=1975070 RepID=A0A2H0RCC7_9BACT|nr:MAG: hypothetical protein COV23_01130 [Candidatus Wolfebacteria bacterium CG10_big_fil_rev_8_21_14_0_10_31_9]